MKLTFFTLLSYIICLIAITKSSPYNLDKRATTGVYELRKIYDSRNFFQEFMFYHDQRDPTNGPTQFIDRDSAAAANLTSTNTDGTVSIRYGPVNTTTGNTTSVRLESKAIFTTGLFVVNATHMPVGCGLWPSFWTVARNPPSGWPQWGEIDIIETVNEDTRNMMSIHTLSGCSVDEITGMEGSWNLAYKNISLATNCASAETDNEGCSVISNSTRDVGSEYNSNLGGVHVMEWHADNGIATWFFPHDQVPSDLLSGSPSPNVSTWGLPQAHWPSKSCRNSDFFKNHALVFSNAVCGDWAGDIGVWRNPSRNGQTSTCQATTGFDTCEAYHASNPDMPEAYWTINNVKVYQNGIDSEFVAYSSGARRSMISEIKILPLFTTILLLIIVLF